MKLYLLNKKEKIKSDYNVSFFLTNKILRNFKIACILESRLGVNKKCNCTSPDDKCNPHLGICVKSCKKGYWGDCNQS